jgi:hypothetical protein
MVNVFVILHFTGAHSLFCPQKGGGHTAGVGKDKMSTAKGYDDNTDLPATSTQEDAQRVSMIDQLFAACDCGDVDNASRLLAALPEVNLNTIKWSEDGAGKLTLLTHARDMSNVIGQRSGREPTFGRHGGCLGF